MIPQVHSEAQDAGLAQIFKKAPKRVLGFLGKGFGFGGPGVSDFHPLKWEFRLWNLDKGPETNPK